MSTQELFIEVLSLPVSERAELAERLLTSLEKEAVPGESDALQQEEAAARCKAFDAGKLTDRDAEDVFGEAYVKLR